MNARPLLICDCDEVLLHFVGPFADFLSAHHDMELRLESFALSGNVRRRACGSEVPQAELWPLLDGFFAAHMDSQHPADGVADALARLGGHADIVILTNIDDAHRDIRQTALRAHGIDHRVVCNTGPKGRPVAELAIDRSGPVAFVDDLPPHHASVAKHAPRVHRLHMVADVALRPLIPPAPDAHARIDRWADATPWLEARLTGASA